MWEKRSLGMAYVMVKEFLCDWDGTIYGITGLRWPDGDELQVRFEAQGALAETRPSFEQLCRPGYGGRALSDGGMLRMPLFTDPSNSGCLLTDWPQVLTYDQVESDNLMRYGHGHVRIFTPQDVASKRHWLEASPQGRELVEANLAVSHGVNREEMIEELLASELPGRERYRALCYLYNVDASMRASPRELDIVGNNLMAFFEQPEISPIVCQGRPGYRPVKPYLLVRSLDESNRVRTSFAFKPSDAENVRRDAQGRIVEKHFLTPDECVNKLLSSLQGLPRFDVLPCMVYPFSMEQLRMGQDKNGQMIRDVARMNRESHCIDQKGSFRPLVREMGLKLAPGGSFVIVESIFDQRLPVFEPELLTRDNECYQRCPAQMPRQKARPSEQARPEARLGMRPGW